MLVLARLTSELLLPSAAWWSDFVRSPGFGGVAAVLAASIAFEAGRRSVRHQREASRKQQSWDRARWALDLTLADDSHTQEVGFGVLTALADSEYAAEHEASVIDAAVRPALTRNSGHAGDRSTPVDPVARHRTASHWEHEEDSDDD